MTARARAILRSHQECGQRPFCPLLRGSVESRADTAPPVPEILQHGWQALSRLCFLKELHATLIVLHNVNPAQIAESEALQRLWAASGGDALPDPTWRSCQLSLLNHPRKRHLGYQSHGKNAEYALKVRRLQVPVWMLLCLFRKLCRWLYQSIDCPPLGALASAYRINKLS